MGFREQHRAKIKQRVLEVSQRWIAEGKDPKPLAMAHLAQTTTSTAARYQKELIQEGLLRVPEGLRSTAVDLRRSPRNSVPKSNPVVLAAARAKRAKRTIQSYSERAQIVKALKERRKDRVETIREIYQQRKEDKENDEA